MFIFLLFDVFDSAYKNGFADGFSAVVLIRAAVAVYAWKRKCNRFRADFVTFLRKAGENAAGPYEVDRFENQISDCWCLPEAIRRRIIALLPPVRDYATQSFRTAENFRRLSRCQEISHSLPCNEASPRQVSKRSALRFPFQRRFVQKQRKPVPG